VIGLLELIDSNYGDLDFPAKSELPYVLATCYNRLGREDEAIEWYKKSIEQYPRSRYAPRAAYRIGVIYAQEKKENENAIYWFEKQMELYPGQSEKALHFIQVIYVHRLGDWVKGAEACQQYMERYPDGRQVCGSLCNMAFCLKMLGDREEAKELFWQAYDRAESDNLRAEIMYEIERLEKGDGNGGESE